MFAGFLAAAVLRLRLERQGVDGPLGLVAIGLAISAVLGVELGALAWVSAGPGRLVEVGPDLLLIGRWSAVEIGLAAIALALSGFGGPGRRGSRRRHRVPTRSDPRCASVVFPFSQPSTHGAALQPATCRAHPSCLELWKRVEDRQRNDRNSATRGRAGARDACIHDHARTASASPATAAARLARC